MWVTFINYQSNESRKWGWLNRERKCCVLTSDENLKCDQWNKMNWVVIPLKRAIRGKIENNRQLRSLENWAWGYWRIRLWAL
jgi:hypothetical protein